MNPILLTIFTSSTCTLFGSDKSAVTLSKKGHSSSGGEDRGTEIKLSNGWNNGPMSSVVKIKALQQQLKFYQLMDSKKVDLTKIATAAYTEKPLRNLFQMSQSRLMVLTLK